MGIFDRLFKKNPARQPEDYFTVTLTENYVKVEHPERKEERINWADIEEVRLINTDQGPWLPDVWLALIGEDTGCLLPQGAKGFDEVYDRVSQYEGFNFENALKSMRCTDNEQFVLWRKNRAE